MSNDVPAAGRPSFYTVAETAALLRVDTATIYRAIREEIAAVVPGFADYEARVAHGAGFTLPHPPRDRRAFPTPSGRARFTAGERDPVALVGMARAKCEAEALARIDYIELRDAASLEPVEDEVRRPAVLAMAVFIGNTRLIDNTVLAP